MKVWRGFMVAVVLLTSSQFVPTIAAQEMDTLDGIFRREYEQLLPQENALLQEVENLKGLKSRVDDMIDQVIATPTADYAKEADRYQRLQLLLPSVIKYSQELDQTLKKLDVVQRKKADLRAKVLERQSAVPIWWTQ